MKDIALFGAGLLGKSVMNKLLEEGYYVDVFDMDCKKIKDINKLDNEKVNFYNFDLGKNPFSDFSKKHFKLMNKKYFGTVNCTYPYVNKVKPTDGISLSSSEVFSQSVSAHLSNSYDFMSISSEVICKGGCAISFASMYGSFIPDFDIYKGTNMTTPPDYVASKAGIIMLNKYFASFYKRNGIRFNTISPGGVFDNQDPLFVEKYTKKSLHSSMLDTNDILGSIIFLLSDGGRMITGQDIIIDGGYNL